MFGMGFSELLIIVVIAILFLGPDKLPSTIVEIAKFFKNVKQTINSVKSSINDELELEDIKKEAEAYKQKLLETQSKINSTVNLSHLDDEINDIVDKRKNRPGLDENLISSINQDNLNKENTKTKKENENA
jgi:sec-independent protein translocase protein TatB